MRKKPKPRRKQRLAAIWWSGIKGNPIKFGATVLGLVIAIGGTYQQWDNLVAVGNHVRWATPVEAQQLLDHYDHKRIVPIVLVQNTQATAIDRFLLYQQQEALAKAQADPASRTSPTVQERIRELNQQIQDTQSRINKAGVK